jgi:hypothetical protein
MIPGGANDISHLLEVPSERLELLYIQPTMKTRLLRRCFPSWFQSTQLVPSMKASSRCKYVSGQGTTSPVHAPPRA